MINYLTQGFQYCLKMCNLAQNFITRLNNDNNMNMSQEKFYMRHNGPREHETGIMLKKIGVGSLDELINQTIPSDIRFDKPLALPDGISEYEYLKKIRAIAAKNKMYKSFIGMGYYNTIMPAVIQRNILENPSWYTSYTPYQAEISQGRLEALLNFQTVITSLTGMDIANASLLDEATAAAEAMIMMYGKRGANGNKLFVDEDIFPQNLDVIITRAQPLGIEIITGKYETFSFAPEFFGAMVQYPNAKGTIKDYKNFIDKAHASKAYVTVIADIMSLVLLTPPGEWGADVVVGSTQRFGIPMGFGGPHAAYFATRDAFKRNMPGRIIGISVDMHGNQALRMALQTREQHIKREKATSNICTAQALLATMAGMYCVYHGPEGLKNIATRIHLYAAALAAQLETMGFAVQKNFFDTLHITLSESVKITALQAEALKSEMNFRYIDDKNIGISIDETTQVEDLNTILGIFAQVSGKKAGKVEKAIEKPVISSEFIRTTPILQDKIFNLFQSETEMMRYIKKLERKDISLTHSMISLGSCTMKLNSAVSMFAMSWAEFGNIHPFVPADQAAGYMQLISELEHDLAVITGFAGISLQPNSGAAGEYAGLLVIRQYHISRGEGHRNVVLIPASAHGTNPASAAMAGMQVVVVDCDAKGNIDVDDLRKKAALHQHNLSCFMVTYPSTHGVFEFRIREMMDIIHQHGGQVYMDGANMNAQVGLTSPGFIGADVCHLNLHKTFAIPHGGGGPGIGPIGVAKHLVDFLPGHPVVKTGGHKAISAVASAPYGSAMALTISHAYIKMMGGNGLTEATRIAILNANYLAAALKNVYGIVYTGETGRVAHEMILDARTFKHDCDVESADIARRLMDFGYHAPTLSFPVHETLMIEPTESESLQELDRFIETMLLIKEEIDAIKSGKSDKTDNPLKNAPHTAMVVTADEWKHSYSRQKAAFPLPWVALNKFWPSVGKIDAGYGDRNLVCTCSPISEYK